MRVWYFRVWKKAKQLLKEHHKRSDNMNASLSVLFVVFYHRMFKGHIHSCLGFSQSNKGRSKAFQTVYKTTIGTAKSYIMFLKQDSGVRLFQNWHKTARRKSPSNVQKEILTVVKAVMSRPHSLKLDLWVVLQSAYVILNNIYR